VIRAAARIGFFTRLDLAARHVGVIGLVFLAGCGSDGRDTALLVGTSFPDELRERVERSFEAENPSIDVRFVEAGDGVAALVNRDSASAFDVWWAAPATVLHRAAEAGLLQPHRPAWVTESGGDAEHVTDLWHPVLLTPFVIAFNREVVPIARAPRDWRDIFHLRWLEEVYALDPTRSADGAYFIGAMAMDALRRDGDVEPAFDWLVRLERQIGRWVGEPGDAIRALGADNAKLAILPRAVVEAARSRDASWLHYRAPTTGTPQLTLGIAIMRGTTVDEAARRFVDHVGTTEVVTESKLLTHWDPAHGAVAETRLPSGFEIEQRATVYPLALDTLVTEIDGWVSRWDLQIRGR